MAIVTLICFRSINLRVCIIFIDQNNHLIRLENCIFLENGGTGKQTDFGAALGLSYAVRFTQRVTSTRQEIVNW